MLAKPFGCPGGCAILQNIDNLAPLQVDNNGPVSAALSPAPVVDARHPYSRLGADTGDLPFQMPQNGVVADRTCRDASSTFLPAGRPFRVRKDEQVLRFAGFAERE